MFLREVSVSLYKGLGVAVFPGLRRIGVKLGQGDGMELLGGVGRHKKFLLFIFHGLAVPWLSQAA